MLPLATSRKCLLTCWTTDNSIGLKYENILVRGSINILARGFSGVFEILEVLVGVELGVSIISESNGEFSMKTVAKLWLIPSIVSVFGFNGQRKNSFAIIESNNHVSIF